MQFLKVTTKTHPCINCNNISDLCSWRTKAQCPFDLSAILCIKNYTVLYISGMILSDDVVNVWETGKRGGEGREGGGRLKEGKEEEREGEEGVRGWRKKGGREGGEREEKAHRK